MLKPKDALTALLTNEPHALSAPLRRAHVGELTAEVAQLRSMVQELQRSIPQQIEAAVKQASMQAELAMYRQMAGQQRAPHQPSFAPPLHAYGHVQPYAPPPQHHPGAAAAPPPQQPYAPPPPPQHTQQHNASAAQQPQHPGT